MLLNRRRMLTAATAATVIASRTARAQTASGPLSAVVEINGRTYTFDESEGTDLGDFASPIGGFTQRCIRVHGNGIPLTVFFRPDRTSSRVEVVFELGRLFSGTPAHLGAYTARILRGGQEIARIDVPAHYWLSRWRWQSEPRPVVGNITQLINDGLLPPLAVTATDVVIPAPTPQPAPAPEPIAQPTPVQGDVVCSVQQVRLLGSPGAVEKLVCTPSGAPAIPVTVTASSQSLPSTLATTVSTAALTTVGGVAAVGYTIMGLAGLQPIMAFTGERDDIGLVTESQAQFIVTRSADALATLLAQGEASGTVPWHFRDENTGAPINFRTYPDASWYPPRPFHGHPRIPTIEAPVVPDLAHTPAVAYVPYLLTGDPYYLEALQFMANDAWGQLPFDFRPVITQSRAFAWGLRTLAQAARVTPANVPAWLLPQSYWMGFVSQWRDFVTSEYVNNPDPLRAIFRSTADMWASRDEANAPEYTWIDPWQEEFVSAVIGWMILMGYSDWRQIFEWKVGSTIARTSGTSGWVRAHATPFRAILRESATAPLARSWAEAWRLSERIGGLRYSDPDQWEDIGDMTYLHYSRGVLALAHRLGVPGAAENLAWATGQLTSRRNWPVPYKWQIAA